MKVIKRIRRQSTEQKLYRFYREIGIITKIILAGYTAIALILLFTQPTDNYSFSGLFAMRIFEIIFFAIVGVSDLKREEEKGSFFLLISFIFKNLGIWSIHKFIAIFVVDWADFNNLALTAIPIQYLFMVMIEDAFSVPQDKKYLFSEPFQLKAKFYPGFIFILLMITEIRVDLILPFFMGIVVHYCRINKALTWVSGKVTERCLSERMSSWGFIKQGRDPRPLKQMDQLTTNDSIFLQQK